MVSMLESLNPPWLLQMGPWWTSMGDLSIPLMSRRGPVSRSVPRLHKCAQVKVFKDGYRSVIIHCKHTPSLHSSTLASLASPCRPSAGTFIFKSLNCKMPDSNLK